MGAHAEPLAGNVPFSVRAATARDAATIAALSSVVYGRPRDPAHVRWKLFETAVAPPAPPSFVAERDGEVIGHYAGSPIRFHVKGAERTGLHGCDVMTSAAVRRRGVLTALGGAAHEAWRRSGLVFVTGLVNEAWGSRSAALGWRNTFAFRWLVAVVRPEAVLARRLRMPAIRRATGLAAALNTLLRRGARRDAELAVEEATGDADLAGVDDLWERLADEHELSVVRDRRWLEWRYRRVPDAAYRILLARRAGGLAGFGVFTSGGPTGRPAIAELFTARADLATQDALVRGALRLLEAEGAETVCTLAVPGSPFWQAFRRAGFLPRGAYTFEVVPLDPAIPFEVLSDPRRWMLAGGDFDVL